MATKTPLIFLEIGILETGTTQMMRTLPTLGCSQFHYSCDLYHGTVCVFAHSSPYILTFHMNMIPQFNYVYILKDILHATLLIYSSTL